MQSYEFEYGSHDFYLDPDFYHKMMDTEPKVMKRNRDNLCSQMDEAGTIHQKHCDAWIHGRVPLIISVLGRNDR